MDAIILEGTTRMCGVDQGYIGLPVRDETIVDELLGGTINVMHTAWKPSPEEIAAIVAGSCVIVSMLGNNPQPLQVGVEAS